MNAEDKSLKNNIERVEHIVSECVRHASMGLDELRSLPNPDKFFTTLPHPSGRGEILAGSSAMAALREVAVAALERGKFPERFSHQTATKIAGKHLVDRFLVREEAICERSVAKLISDIERTAKSQMRKFEHIVPAHLALQSTPTQITLGSVRFTHSNLFRSELIANRNQYPRDEANGWNRKSQAQAIRYFRNFDWVVSASIESACRKSAREIADRAIEYAIGFVHAFIGGSRSGDMKVGGVEYSRDNRARFYKEGGSPLNYCLSSQGKGQVGIPKDWGEWFHRPEARPFISLISAMLTEYTTNGYCAPVSQRLLDSLAWYGDAAREQFGAAQVIKYVTAIERLIITQPKSDGTLAEVLRTRVASLCANPAIPEDYDFWQGQTDRIYDLRSRLVHGSGQRDQLDFTGIEMPISEWARDIIFAMMEHLSRGPQGPMPSEKRVDNWFSKMMQFNDQMRQTVRQITTHSHTIPGHGTIEIHAIRSEKSAGDYSAVSYSKMSSMTKKMPDWNSKFDAILGKDSAGIQSFVHHQAYDAVLVIPSGRRYAQCLADVAAGAGIAPTANFEKLSEFESGDEATDRELVRQGFRYIPTGDEPNWSRVLLIDDVVDSGATIDGAIKAIAPHLNQGVEIDALCVHVPNSASL